MSHPVIELQAADTMADQLRHRREHLGERERLQAARNDLVRWDQARTVLRKRLDELAQGIEGDEQETASIDRKRTKLQAQLRTVIAPREAEALQHEIATLEAQRADIDERELEAMDEQARLDDELAALVQQEPALREVYLAADAELQAANRDIDAELARVGDRLDGLRAALEPRLLERYDRLRQQLGVAAATLAGTRCDGCHLDLSAVEVDAVRAAASAAGGVTECPQCGRLLVA